MNKTILTAFTISFFTFTTSAQIGINSDNSAPHPSAQLDVKSTEKGFLLPRMTTLERNAIQNPEIGLMVFDKDLQEIFIFNNDGWKQGTLSKLPLEINTDKLFGLKVTNSNITNPTFGLSAAGYFNYTGTLGHAIYARSNGNLPTMVLESEGTSFALSAKSSGNTTAFFQNTNNNKAIDGRTGYNHFINGENNSYDYATAKFTNNDINGKSIEANARVEINVNNLVGLKVTNTITNSYPNGSTAAEFANNDILGTAISAKSSGNVPTVLISNNNGGGLQSNSNGSGYGGAFSSEQGIGVLASAQNNSAITGFNNSSLLPTAYFKNNGNGRSLYVDGEQIVYTSNRQTALRVENSNNIQDGNDYAAGLFIHSGQTGTALIARSINGNAISARSSGNGAGVSGESTNGNGGFFYSQNQKAIYGYSINNSGIELFNASITYPTAKFTNHTQPGGVALELNGNISLNGKIINEAYQYPTFENNWENYGGDFNNAKYYKDKENRVHLAGAVKNGTNTRIFTLPNSHKPSNRLSFAVSTQSGFGKIDITPEGYVLISMGSFNQVNLDGISFRVD